MTPQPGSAPPCRTQPQEASLSTELLDQLKVLPQALFEEVLFRLRPPPGLIPPSPADQITRAIALITWAEWEGGIGLTRVAEELGRVGRRGARPEPEPGEDLSPAAELAQAKGQGAKVAPPGRQDRQESTPVQKNADRRTGQGKEKRVSEHRPKSTPNPILEDLRQKIRDRQVLVIVGAGVSIASSNRAPVASWVGLLQHGVQRVVDLECEDTDWKETRLKDIQSGKIHRMLTVAEEVATLLEAPAGGEYKRWLRESVGALRVEDRTLIEAITRLGCPIATTNYDSLLSEVTGQPPVTWEESSDFERVIKGDDQGILHLHGHWKRPTSVILGIRDYTKVLGNQHAQAIQQALRTTRTLLFIGCGAGTQDPNIGALLRWSGQVFAGSEYRHYRLERESEVAERQKEHPPEQRIQVLGYGAKHADLAGFLARLVAEDGAEEDVLPSPPPPPPDPLTPIKQHLKEDANCLAGIFTRVGGPQVLSDVYVELRLNPQTLPDTRHVGQELEKFDHHGPQKLEQVITRQDRRRWIVLGDPGSGKTTLLHHLVLQSLEGGGALPLYLKVGDVCDAGSLEEALTRIFGPKNKALAWAEVQAGRAVVLLDGLDEALDPAQARTRVIAAASEVGNSVLVVASRKVGYDTNPLPVSFGELHLLDLDDRAQEDLLTRWIDDRPRAVSTLTRLRRHERMKRMVGNPLLLTLVGLLLREREPVPEKRGLLYRSALTLLMKREHTLGGATRRLREPATAERLMALVALKLHGQERDAYPTADITRVLSEPNIVQTLRLIWGGPEAFLEEVAVTTGLLVPDRSRRFEASGYTFPHRTFREYLAAVGLEEDIGSHGIGSHWSDSLSPVVGPGQTRHGARTSVEGMASDKAEQKRLGFAGEGPSMALGDTTQLTRVLTEAKTKPSTWSEVLALTCGLLGRGAGDALVRRVAREGSPELTLRVVAEAEGIREDTVSLVLGLDTDSEEWERRKDVLQQIPTLVGDAGSAARLIWKFIQQTSNGNDLYWAREVLHTIHRGEATTGPLGTSDADKADALDYASRIFDHLRGERWEEAKAILEGQLVDVPAGTFWMGNARETDPDAFDDETPRHPVTLTWPYRLQRLQVTNTLYELFDPGHVLSRKRWQGGPDDELDQHPVVNVTWYEATMFAAWIGATIPTEAQWEWAARGREGRKYPWGSGGPTPELANYHKGGSASTTPVGFYPGGASWVGALDMAGNVREWCQDWYGPYPPDEQVDPAGPTNGSLRAIRGGSWNDGAGGLRASLRFWDVPSWASYNLGFRVVLASAG